MLFKKGAEASLYIEEWCGRRVILKRRLPKVYRAPELDKEIRFRRTKHESHLLHKAKVAGVPTPIVFMVDDKEATIIMEFIDGEQVKQVLQGISNKERMDLCQYIGELIGRLHKGTVVHGDLTTSNMILTPSKKVVFVDFGLGEQTEELEARGIDLHLLKNAFKTTSFTNSQQFFKAVMNGYRRVCGTEATDAVLKKISSIERRGRYVSNRSR